MNITLIINFIDAIGHNVLALLKCPQIFFLSFLGLPLPARCVFNNQEMLLVFTDLSLGT